MTHPSERLDAIVAQLDIRPDDRVLEIVCGHGVAATMVCGAARGRRIGVACDGTTVVHLPESACSN